MTKSIALLGLVCVVLLGCGGSGDSTPSPEPVADGDAGASPMPAPVDRACVTGEQGYVTAFALSLTSYGCTEVVNRSGIAGGRSWCCPSGTRFE